jgi:hypothetical protein
MCALSPHNGRTQLIFARMAFEFGDGNYDTTDRPHLPRAALQRRGPDELRRDEGN